MPRSRFGLDNEGQAFHGSDTDLAPDRQTFTLWAIRFRRPDLAIQFHCPAKRLQIDARGETVNHSRDLTDHGFLPGQCPVLGPGAQQEESQYIVAEEHEQEDGEEERPTLSVIPNACQNATERRANNDQGDGGSCLTCSSQRQHCQSTPAERASGAQNVTLSPLPRKAWLPFA